MSWYTSRFFRVDDSHDDQFIFDLPQPSWWSRPYEYAWASKFCESSDVALDAACGVEHPFRFFLLDHCREAYACDIDGRILESAKVLQAIENSFGKGAAAGLPQRYLNNIHYVQSPLTSLPYPDKMFDKIYCLSVLEHLHDLFNRHPVMWHLGIFRRFLRREIWLSLEQFKRILKDDGLIILTFDYPGVALGHFRKHVSMVGLRLKYSGINLGYFKEAASSLGLTFAGDSSFEIPKSAVYSPRHRLYCFRAVLRKVP